MDGYGNTQILPHPINRPESFKFAILQVNKTPVILLAEISRRVYSIIRSSSITPSYTLTLPLTIHHLSHGSTFQ